MSTANDGDGVKPKREPAKPAPAKPAPQAPDSAATRGWKKASRYLGEVRTELRKATWPNRAELIAQTQVVLGLLAVVGIFIFAWDQVLGQIMHLVERALGISS